MINIFTDGASKGNPGNSGLGVAIYDGKEIKEEIFEFLGKKTNNEAEYLAFIKGIEKLIKMKETKANFFSDSEFLVKQMKGQYKVKAEKIVPLYEKAKELTKNLEITINWIPREDNKLADELANKAIEQAKNNNSKDSNLKLDKAFFGKINCIKIQLNNENDIYFHMGLVNPKSKEWRWEKVKMSDIELGELIYLLKKETGKCAFYHKFGDSKTQIWCNKSPESFSIKVNDISKNLSIGEFEVFKIILEECIKIRNFN